jgi:ketosteroid isomerase-like protein
LIERLFHAFNERDVDEVLELCDPDVEFRPVSAELARSGKPYIGHGGIQKYFADVAGLWEALEVTVHEVREASGAVLVVGRVIARDKERGVRDLPAGWVWRLREQRFVYGRVYADPRDAAREAGLEATSPEGGP